jgi:hypothetical protein
MELFKLNDEYEEEMKALNKFLPEILVTHLGPLKKDFASDFFTFHQLLPALNKKVD